MLNILVAVFTRWGVIHSGRYESYDLFVVVEIRC
jgi:hypothetical protein